jgi:hypothetical protein
VDKWEFWPVLLFDTRRLIVRRTALCAVILIFNVTLMLNTQSGGGFGLAEAQAAPPKAQPSVYVVPFQRGGEYVSQISLGKIESYYRMLLSMNPEVGISDGVVVPDVPAVDAPKKNALTQDKDLEAADKKLWAGKELMRSKKWRKAVRSFASAVKKYKKKLAVLEDMDKMVEAMLLMSIARFAQGYEDDGEEVLAKVLALRPDLVVDRRWESPAFTAALKRLKSGLFRVPTGTITVACPGAGCRVFVDGVSRGSNGAQVKGLARGHHYIRVVTPGYLPWSTMVFTPGKGQTKRVTAKPRASKKAKHAAIAKPKAVKVDPAALAGFVRQGNYGAQFLGMAGEFARQAKADHIVMGFVNRVGQQYVVAGYVYSASNQQVAEVTKTLVAIDISDMQVKLLNFEQTVAEAVAKFPTRRVVTQNPPRVYAAYNPPVVAPPVVKPVVVTPPPTVAVAPPVVAPVPVAVRPAPVATPPVATPPVGVVPTPGQPGYRPPVVAPPGYQPRPVYGQPGQPQDQPPAQPTYGQPAAPVYGQPAQPARPVYGQPGQPAAPVYGQPGQPAAPVYGQPARPVYGQPGQPAAPVYGQPGQPAAPVYGQPAQPVYGQPGQPAAPVYGQPGQPAAPVYAQPVYRQPVYGQPVPPTYGQPVPPPTYGQPAPPPTYGQPAPPPTYGQPAPPPTYGQPAAPPVYAQPAPVRPVVVQPPAVKPPAVQPSSVQPVVVAKAPTPPPTEMRRGNPTIVARAPRSAAAPAEQPNLNPVTIDDEDDEPLYKKWWFWTAVIGGTAAVSAAIAIPLALQGGDATPERTNATVNWE